MHIVKVEGVNFDACIYDTDNLNVVRGASLLMEAMPDAVLAHLKSNKLKSGQLVVQGGSIAVIQFDTEQDAEKANESIRAFLNTGDYAHLSFVVTLGTGTDINTAINDATNAGRIQQLQELTYRPFDTSSPIGQDTLDQKRPAAYTDEKLEKNFATATSVRFKYGRKQRKNFFKDQLSKDQSIAWDDVTLCNDLHEIVSGAAAIS